MAHTRSKFFSVPGLLLGGGGALAAVVVVVLGVIVAEEVEEDGTLAFRAPRIGFRQHDVHQTPRTPDEHHRRRRLRAARILQTVLRRHARARR